MVKNCATCNRIFDDYLDIYKNCPECREKEAGLLRQVEDYLWDYPGATEGKLREVFGVTHQQVTTWLREERIEITPDSSIKLTCLRCGSMILKGKYCPDCAKRIGAQLEQLKNELSPKQERQHKNIYSMVVDKDMAPGGKMHFLQNASRERRSNSESHIIDDEHDT
jgi:predicted  nucleic acid-binding Zn-ribbon protein